MQQPLYYTYMLSNWTHSVLYTGMTNHLGYRLVEHWMGKADSFTMKNRAYYLLWYEETRYVLNAIAREKEIKLWLRVKKVALIESVNPQWQHLNTAVLGNWPPTDEQVQDTIEWRRHEDEVIRRKKG